MNSPRFVQPLEKAAAQQGIETFARPLLTMLENFKNGQLETSNKAVTFQAIENAIAELRKAYGSIGRAA